MQKQNKIHSRIRKAVGLHLAIALMVSTTLVLGVVGGASAAEPPSNEELYNMILQLKADQQRLKQEAAQAKVEAAKAWSELDLTRRELGATKQELDAARAALDDTQEVVAATQQDIAEMGTAPSSSVLRIRESDRGPYASLDFIYKRPENDRLVYALLTDNTRAQESTTLEVDTDYEPGVRIGGGYHFNRGTEGFVQFSYLDTSASDTTAAPSGTLDLNPTLVPEEDLDFDRDDDLGVSASASYDLDYRVVDAGFAQNFGIGDQLYLRLGGGIRYASIDDELSARYIDTPITREITVKQTNDFWGIGPRVTLDAIWNVNNSGFSIFGNVGGALLYGENDLTYIAEDVDPNDNDIVSFDSEEKHLFPVLEASVGVKYSAIKNNIGYSLQLGYEFETWLDSLSSVTFVDDTTDELFTREDTDLELHGLFLRGQISW